MRSKNNFANSEPYNRWRLPRVGGERCGTKPLCCVARLFYQSSDVVDKTIVMK